jgi:NADH-quinone oxidoreductase subunit M
MLEDLPIISLTLLLPIIGALYISFFVGSDSTNFNRSHASYAGLLTAVLNLICCSFIVLSFNNDIESYQFVESYGWLDVLGLAFSFGIDGISLYFVFLTSFLTLICLIFGKYVVKDKIKEYVICFLLLESCCIGAFTSLNLLLFYLFFEFILIPMYLIIGIWGSEERIYAAVKFFIYTFCGSMCFLVFLFYVYCEVGTFEIITLTKILPQLDSKTQYWLWTALMIAFAVKIPMIPIHGWLPDAHVQAPTTGSVMLAGILLKLGSYALLRTALPMLPLASYHFSDYVLYLSVGAIIFASLVALAQQDMKKMIAYSSIAHMGYVTAGIFSFTEEGINGALFQMISHGVVSSALFLVVGILYERNHTKDINMYSGVASKMPILAVLFMISLLSSIALPGTGGFIGEFLSLIGLSQVSMTCTVIASSGVVLGVLYMLKLYKKVMFGEISERVLKFQELKKYEIFSLMPLCFLVLYMGFCPNKIIDTFSKQTNALVKVYTPFR